MPMIELTMPKGALAEEAKERLAGELATLALELEAAPMARFGDVAHMQALAWCFISEQDVFVGGERLPKPVYRVTVSLPEGAPGLFGPLAARNRGELVRRATESVLAAEGSENDMVEAHRVWVHLKVIADGHWGAFGAVLPMSDIAAYSMGGGEPGGHVQQMRDAALTSVGQPGPGNQ